MAYLRELPGALGAWSYLHTTKVPGELAAPGPRGLFTCTGEGLKAHPPLSLRLVNPAKKVLPLVTVPDPRSFLFPNFAGAGLKGAPSLAKTAFFWLLKNGGILHPKWKCL